MRAHSFRGLIALTVILISVIGPSTGEFVDADGKRCIIDVTRAGDPPGSPGNLTVLEDTGYPRLDWEPPNDGGDPGIISYIILRGLSEEDLASIDEISSAYLHYYDTTAPGGNRLYYSVQAVNASGTSEAAAPVSIDLLGRPLPVGNLTGERSDGKVNLSWELPPEDPLRPISGIIVNRTRTGNDLVPEEVFDLPPDSNGTTDLGLENGVEYGYSVHTYNEKGDSEEVSLEIIPGRAPDSPQDVILMEEEGSIAISWERPLNNGGFPISGYTVFRSVNGGEFEAIGFPDQDEISYVDISVSAGPIYMYYVISRSEIGTSPPSERVSYRIAPDQVPPSEPEVLRVRSGRDHVNLTWTAPRNPGSGPLLGYRIFRTTQGSEEKVLDEVAPDVLFYNDTSVMPALNYTYSVAALNEAGESDRGPRIIVNIRETDEPGDQDEDDRTSGGGSKDNTAVILGIIIGVIIIGIGVAVYLRMTRKLDEKMLTGSDMEPAGEDKVSGGKLDEGEDIKEDR